MIILKLNSICCIHICMPQVPVSLTSVVLGSIDTDSVAHMKTLIQVPNTALTLIHMQEVYLMRLKCYHKIGLETG